MIGFNHKRQNESTPARRESALDKALDAQSRRELAAAVSAIADQQRNAALVATDDEALDLHGQLLVGALRQRGSLQVELYLPSSTEALLGRFNALLADIPLEQARHTGPLTGPLRVWVVHAGRNSELRDAKLLLRLIAEFPGARVRALLLFEASACDGVDFEALGPRLHRWVIGPVPEASRLEGDRPTLVAVAPEPRHEPALPTPTADAPELPWHLKTWAERSARQAQLLGMHGTATPRPAKSQPAVATPKGKRTLASVWKALTQGSYQRLRMRLASWSFRRTRLAQGLRARLRPTG